MTGKFVSPLVYKYLSDADPRNAFDIEKFLSHQLDLKEKDSFDTYEIAIDDDEYDIDPEDDAPDECIDRRVDLYRVYGPSVLHTV